jgi:hypothetical protein
MEFIECLGEKGEFSIWIQVKIMIKSDQKLLGILDSLIYEYLLACGDPLEELGGDHLGDWKIEVFI